MPSAPAVAVDQHRYTWHMNDPDTGLHVSMRLLFGIIAGLIVTDLLKAFVRTISSQPTLQTAGHIDFLVAGAALIFVSRVLVDNGLYYYRADARTLRPVYFTRMLLILCDLVSYALCYYIVVQVEGLNATPADRAPDATSALAQLRAVGCAIIAIEALHCVWCCVALAKLDIPTTSPDYEPRRSWLKRWAVVSGAGTVLGLVFIVASVTHAWQDEEWTTFVILFAITSTVAYIIVMRPEYLGVWRYVPEGEPLLPVVKSADDPSPRRENPAGAPREVPPEDPSTSRDV